MSDKVTTMTINCIETRLRSVDSSLRGIGDERTVKAMQETCFVMAEVRHFCASIAGLAPEQHAAAAERLTTTIRDRYCEKEVATIGVSGAH